MKQKLLIFLFLCFSINSFSQEIALDRIENDGRRQLMSSAMEVELDDAEYRFIVKGYERSGLIEWILLVSSYYIIPKNAVLLIKLGNNDTRSIPINNLHVGKVSTPSYSLLIGNIAYNTPSNNVDYYSAVFDLSEEQFNEIEKYGIIKVRISSQNSYREKVWRKDKLGKFIAKCRANMAERFATTRVKSIYEDF